MNLRFKSLLAGAALGLAGLVLLGSALWLAGIRHVYFHHVIATFEISGLNSTKDASDFQDRLASFPGLRQMALARGAGPENLWIARIQFSASSPQAGWNRIREWIETSPSAQTLRLVKATFYRCRLDRPKLGDIVLGNPLPVDDHL
jgi:hypothetical protein